MLNYWDISLDQGIVKIEMVLTHGNEVTSLKVEGSKALSSGETSREFSLCFLCKVIITLQATFSCVILCKVTFSFL